MTGVFVIFQQSFTTLGVALAKVELNEANFSEVLRLFILSRNAGDPHPVRDSNRTFFQLRFFTLASTLFEHN